MIKDREEGGQRLLDGFRKKPGRNVDMVLAIPNGGVIIGGYLARALGLPLRLILCKKIVHPKNEELAVGATSFWRGSVIHTLGVPYEHIKRQFKAARELLKKKKEVFGGYAKLENLQGSRVILVDDGATTGTTMREAINVARSLGVSYIHLMVPVANENRVKEWEDRVDEVSVVEKAPNITTHKDLFEILPEVTDQEVMDILDSLNSKPRSVNGEQ